MEPGVERNLWRKEVDRLTWNPEKSALWRNLLLGAPFPFGSIV